MEAANQEFAEIIYHPAGNGGVVHHQHYAAEQAEPAVNVPLAALALKIPVRQNRAAFARAAYRKLHREHRHAHYKQADEIDQDEKAAAVLTRHIREAPDIADSDSAARADKQKA